MAEPLRVVISSDLLSAFANLPRAQQEKTRKFIMNFQRNPRASGLSYEPIRHARDANLFSLRVDDAYRAVVLKPEQGNVYMLLWVDRHDDAYDWAARHECRVNQETGALQIYVPEVDVRPPAPQAAPVPGLFDALKDRELMRLGVPEAMVAAVRQVRDEAGLDAIQDSLPVEAYEGLFLYMAGSAYEDILREREVSEKKVDPADFAAALARADSRSRFVVVDNELELEKMLSAPLERWRVFLHPSQRRLVEREWNGPVRVLGGAGTGKTVVAMHRARWLSQRVLAAGVGRVLFTTFTRNLARDIEHNLRTICTPELLERIEVINLDQWVSRFLRSKRYEFKLAFGDERERLWKKALDLAPGELGLPDAFYRDEWDKVVQPQSVASADVYLRVSRVGRGTTLRRAERAKVWPVFEEYRTLLTEHGLKEVDDAYRDAAALLERNPESFGYRSVVVDEGQDMSAQAFRLIRGIVPQGPNDLFIVGDGHQRIYNRHRVILGKCGIEVRGRSRKLRVNYRTTDEIRRWAVRLLEGLAVDDLDGGTDSNAGYRSLTHGTAPEVQAFDDFAGQARFLAEYLQSASVGSDGQRATCVVARTRSELEALQAALEGRGVPCFVLSKDTVDDAKQAGVRLATMHRVKGLEFDRVIIASVNDGLVPLPQALAARGDEVGTREADLEERALLYVAATRAKREVVVTSYGKASPYVAAKIGR